MEQRTKTNNLFARDVYQDYTVFPLMITNKVFIARNKKIGFQIITYYEFKELIEKEL